MPCIDGETLAAWSAGALGPAAAANVEEHLADCARCQAMLAVFVQAEPIAAATPAWWQRWQVRWLVPLATAATVAAIWIATPAQDVNVQSAATKINTTPAPPAAVPTTQAARTAVEKLQTEPVAPPTGGAATGAGRLEGAVDKPDQKRDFQANAASAREKREATPPTPSAPASSPPTFRAATPVPPPATASPATPRTLQESVAMTADANAIAQRSAGVVEIVSPNAAVRWRIMAGQQLDRTTDSGARWERVAIAADIVLTAGHSPAPDVAWLVGTGGIVLRTTDGSRFERVPFVESVDLVAVNAVDDRQATVTTSDGRVFHTVDGGTTWARR